MSNSDDMFVRAFGGLAAGLIVGAGVMWASFHDEISFARKFSTLKSCDEFLQEKQVNMPDGAEVTPAINGYLSALDKYSYYRMIAGNVEDNVNMVNLTPTALGSGFKLEVDVDGQIFFGEVAADMPAAKQGIRTDDILLAVDGVEIDAADRKSVTSISGKDGTKCRLTVYRDGETVEIDFTRTNSEFKVWDVVESEVLGDTLYIKIPTCENLESLPMLSEEEYSSVIIDLRDNRGGLTSFALQYAADFVAEGYVKYSYFNGKTETFNVENGKRIGVPIVVLVNERTASAAEILTSILKQYANTEIVGMTTRGKGCFQKEQQIEGGVLHYTEGYYTVGRWENWHGVGITPDVEVQMDSELIGTDEDVQLKTALKMLG